MNKLTKREGANILKSFIKFKLPKLKWYIQIKPLIKAMIFYGSTAKETNRADSDLDLLIFVPLNIETKHTKGEYFYKFNNREVNIVLRSIERLRKLGKEQDSLFEAEVFRNCEILYESDFEVRTLIRRITAAKSNCS